MKSGWTTKKFITSKNTREYKCKDLKKIYLLYLTHLSGNGTIKKIVRICAICVYLQKSHIFVAKECFLVVENINFYLFLPLYFNNCMIVIIIVTFLTTFKHVG